MDLPPSRVWTLEERIAALEDENRTLKRRVSQLEEHLPVTPPAAAAVALPQRARTDKRHHMICDGPILRIHGAVTTRTIVGVIDKLSVLFGAGYAFALDPAAEGGIEMIEYPRRNEDEGESTDGNTIYPLKTLRFGYPRKNAVGCLSAPYDLPSWRVSAARYLWCPDVAGKPMKIPLILKAVGAPCWTQEEINKVVEAFEAHGFECHNTTIGTTGRCCH